LIFSWFPFRYSAHWITVFIAIIFVF
jgi:hypothetical protein